MNPSNSKPAGRLPRILISLFAFICLSLTLQLALVPGTANGGTLLASNAQAAAATTQTLTAPDAQAVPEKPREAPDATASVFDADPLQSLAESLRRKERELNEREARIEEQEKALETLRLETQQTLRQIEQVRKDMQSISEKADAQRQKQLKKWIEIYQKMEPAKIGTVLQELDPDFQLEILTQFDPGRAAKILNSFPPAKAAELSKKLGR